MIDPPNMNYAVRWPFFGGSFNTRAYQSNQLIASDVETILRTTLRERFDIDQNSYHVT